MVDNSSSVNYFNAEEKVATVLKTLKKSKKIQDKFDVQYFSFDKKTTVLSADSLSFLGTQTNIYQT